MGAYSLPPQVPGTGGSTGKAGAMGPPTNLPQSPMPDPNQMNTFDADGGGGAMFGPQPGAPRPGLSVGGVGNAIPTLGGGSMGGGVGVRGNIPFKKGGKVDGVAKKGKTSTKMVKMAKGGKVGGASKRGDGIASKGKTRGRFV
jgi:hypothetical protein